jgi:hypothetical protein
MSPARMSPATSDSGAVQQVPRIIKSATATDTHDCRRFGHDFVKPHCTCKLATSVTARWTTARTPRLRRLGQLRKTCNGHSSCRPFDQRALRAWLLRVFHHCSELRHDVSDGHLGAGTECDSPSKDLQGHSVVNLSAANDQACGCFSLFSITLAQCANHRSGKTLSPETHLCCAADRERRLAPRDAQC